MDLLTNAIKAEAIRLGFDLVGIAPVRASDHERLYRAWIAAGRHGEMAYLARPDAVRNRLHPNPEFRSAVVVALNYYQPVTETGPEHAIIARYAHGRDYHKVIKSKLLTLLRYVEQQVGAELPSSRAYVDTGPVLERELAQRAGLGWFGRNTMMINPGRGSYFFLGALLLETELTSDQSFAYDHCGSCSACVQACPTGALLGRDAQGAPIMDATRCISYLTIEQRGPIPQELRPLIGNRVFGCDICQEVCPWNNPKFVQLAREPDFSARAHVAHRQLIDLMAMSESEWDEFSRGSAIRRAKRSGFLRNVAVALGNWGSLEAVPVLSDALRDLEPLVRGHAAWALGRIGGATALDALRDALTLECDAWVREELMLALALPSHIAR
ncbi:MAG TPA: tRNA epoxyqueuosine(34) reductase QueG [Longimicrobiales bacterium]|nr:tRNA epoxyqueuosine(34) reductase QueG [Longimicrobiales bacterium]